MRRLKRGHRDFHRSAQAAFGEGARRLRGRRTTACSWWRPTASRPLTSCSTSRSPTRAGCSPACRRSGSTRPRHGGQPPDLGRPDRLPSTAGPDVAGRAMLVKTAQPVLMECVVRGYLFGSAWSEYEKQGTVNGEPLPPGMVAGRAAAGADLHPHHQGRRGPRHGPDAVDEAIDPGRQGPATSELRDLSIAIYKFGTTPPRRRGILLADTKLEFGTVDGQLHPDRRDPHARLVPVLARRRVRAGHVAARASTSSSSASTSSTGLGRHPARRRPCPTWWSRHPVPLRRGLRAAHRAELRRLVRGRGIDAPTRSASRSGTGPASSTPRAA